jgi:hypothetical protein
VSGCENTPRLNGSSCSNADVCDGDETCRGGICTLGVPRTCNDGNRCTDDFCDPVAGCQTTPAENETPCDDNDVCNGSETCQAGTCTPGTRLACNDGNPCTADGCNPLFGCTAPPVLNNTPCRDENVCNGTESCQSGTCTRGAPLNCDDANACTTDSCDPELGCRHQSVEDGRSCSDGNVCNGAETCAGGACTAGTPLACDDGNPCTIDGCDRLRGCISGFEGTGTPCNDGSRCTQTDICDGAGACVGTNPVVCRALGPCRDVGACNPDTGTCSDPPARDGTPCDNGSTCVTETLSDSCQAGVCADAPACAAAEVAPEQVKEVTVTCTGDGPDDLCEAQAFAEVPIAEAAIGDSTRAHGLAATAPVQTIEENITKKVRKRVRARTGDVKLKLKLNAIGKKLLRQADKERQPLQARVYVTRRSGSEVTSVLNYLVQLVRRR